MAHPESVRKHVLLVEDQKDICEVVGFNLPDYKLVCARNIDEGLRLCRQRYFDLYILDCWLPDGSGVGLCGLIREFDPHTPILMYSAAGSERDKQNALRAGAQTYVMKSGDFGEFKRAVAQLTSVVGERDSEGRLLEITAMREELAVQMSENAEQIKRANMKHLRAAEKLIRLKAERAFLAAGGARGEFARQWPSVFREEVRSRRDNW
jgi:DNA-binding response OmpR family regulator